MADSENGTTPAGVPAQGHRTIKLTPLSVKNTQNGTVTPGGMTVKMTPKPEAAASAAGTHTQAIPLKKPGPVPAPVSLKPANATQSLQPKADTSTKGIPLSGLQSVPQHKSEDDLVSTVKLNRPAPRPLSTQSAPINTHSGAVPAMTRKIPVPTTTAPVQAPQAVSPAAAAAIAQEKTTHSGPIPVATATTSIKISGTPSKKIELGGSVSTATTGIKVGLKPAAATIKLGRTTVTPQSAAAPVSTATAAINAGPVPAANKVTLKPAGVSPTPAEEGEMPTKTVAISRKKINPAQPGASSPPPVIAKAADAAPINTSTTGLRLGGAPSPSGKTIKLDAAPPPAAPSAPAAGVNTSTTGIKIGGMPSPAATTIKLGGNTAVPGAPAAPSLKIKKSEPPPQEEKKEEAPASAPEAQKKEDAPAADGKKKKEKKPKTPADTSAEPHILFSVSSFVALIAVLLLTAIVVIQYLNHWEGMQIQVPGLNFLTLGK